MVLFPSPIKTPGLRGTGAVKRYLMSQVSGSGFEEIPHFHGKEQWLPFAGAAVKRYSKPKVTETQERRCKRASEGRHTETILTEN